MTQTNSQETSLITQARPDILLLPIDDSTAAGRAPMYPPKSGAKQRAAISDRVKECCCETIDLAHQIRVQSADVLNTVTHTEERALDLTALKSSVMKSASAKTPGEGDCGAPDLPAQERGNRRKARRKAANIL